MRVTLWFTGMLAGLAVFGAGRAFSRDGDPPEGSAHEAVVDHGVEQEAESRSDDAQTKPDNRSQNPRASSDTTPPRIDRLTPTPGAWVVSDAGLSQVQIGFTEPVTIPAGSVSGWTIRGGTVTGFTTSYNSVAHTLTIAFPTPIRDDRLTLVADYSITDLAGNELDGEIANPSNPTLPSGDGVRGGQAIFRFSILQGDVNRDGVVNAKDAALLQPSLGLCNDDSGYNVSADLNLDGCVNAQDLAIFALANGRLLPATDGATPFVTEVVPDPTAGLLGPVTSVQVKFSETVNIQRLTAKTCYLIDGNGVIRIPIGIATPPLGNAGIYLFNPALPQCGTYTVNISNATADLSGELLLKPPSLPSLSGLVPPPAPTLNPHTTMTTASQVTITGFAPGAASIEVAHPAGSFTVPVANNSFTANVPLSPNRINPIFFTGLSTCAGVRGPQRVTYITQDTEIPNLYIDFPTDGSRMTTATTDVAGRVGDLLSGYAGLIVTVNGVAAVVDEGIGNNGTFFAQGVPLNMGQPTIIQAVATDALGNNRTRQVTVTRVDIPASAPRMVVVSGNGQVAPIGNVIPQPIVVRMTNADGTPFVNKVVTFDVARSNGRLGVTMAGLLPTPQNHDPGSMKYQVRTDANGEARAYWRLGGDAGCGNNRVSVTSQSIAGTVAFCASAMHGPIRQINIGTGNNQRAEAGGPAPEPLRAWVSDGCNGIEDVQVRFTILQGGGKVNGQDTATVSTARTGHASVNFTLGPEQGNNIIEASVPSCAQIPTCVNHPARFTVYGLKRKEGQPTSFFGVVLNNAGQPIQNAKCVLVVGAATALFVYSDIDGRFEFTNVTGSGDSDLYVDGSTATHIGGPTCTVPSCTVAPNTFPTLHFEMVVVPNAANSLSMPVMLPPLNPHNVVSTYSATPGGPDTILTVEDMKGLQMIVKAGSMKLGNGQPAPTGQPIYLNQVHHDDIPMPIPDGASPPFTWTLQPAGSKFDPPIEIRYPNMSGLPTGAIAYFLSFNHDTSRFEIIASGHVTNDGSMIVTDPGVGLGLAGWGCNCPPYSVTGDCCTGCEDDCCDGGCCCGNACCAGPCCAGGCCAAGGSCCGGSCCDGPCCEETGECCPAGGSCCNGQCCAGPCCEETGECCPAGDKSCCNNQCCAGPCCDGLCCPAGGSCCNGRCCAGPCCEETGECCPAGGSCCAGSCCAGPCCEATGECCPAGGSCCNNECCPGPCCENNCCETGQSCCGDDCCESGKTCCNPSSGLCCAMGRQCCENQTTCCPYNQVCCNEGCCPAGQICCGNECCKPAKCCNNECCGPNEICCNGVCQPTDCSLSLDPGMVCPGGTTQLQGVAICNPQCTTMSLTAEIVEPAMQSLVSVSVSPGSIACGPFKTPYTVTVNVLSDASPGTFTVRVKGKIIDAGDVACDTTAQTTVTIDECVNLTFQGVPNNEEINPGGFLCLNIDDDNDNDTPDKDDAGQTVGEDDLKTLTISLSGGWTGPGMVAFSCEAGCNRIRFYKNPDRTIPVTLPLSWSVPTPELPKTLYVEGVVVSSAPRDIELKALFTGTGGPCEDHVKLTVVQVDLDVNTNRNAVVDQSDDGKEDDWTRDRGAVFMVNYDDDDGIGGPDAMNFDDQGNPIGEDLTVNGAADVADIAPLIIRATGPTANVQYFLRMAADDLKAVHIFQERLAGKTVLWGGWGAHGSDTGVKERDITAFVRPSGDLDLGIEALFFRGQRHNLPGGGTYEFDGEVDIELVVQQTVGATAIVPGKIICTDKVRLKVAPYLMLPNTLDAQEVWMTTQSGANDIAAKFGAAARRVTESVSQWFQDHVQIGYTAMPGQNMYVALRLPYSPTQDTWPMTQLLGPGKGLYRFRNTEIYDGSDSGDFGGNLEVVPPSDEWPLGRIVYGSTMSTKLQDFLKAQKMAGPTAAQEPFPIDTGWLDVGHVDEIVSFLPGGTRGFKVAVASPSYAHQLLTTGDPARGIAPPADETALFALGAQASGIASNSITTDSKVYLFDGVAHGLVRVVAGVALTDGETVGISDGSTVKTFEFNKSGGVGGGRVAVNINDSMDTRAVRDALLGAINGSGLNVDAVSDDPPLGTPDKLIVINRDFGVAGNVPITETVAPGGFIVQGMAGGETPSDGRDFTATSWQFVRLFDGPGSGQVGFIDGPSRRGKGWVSVRPLSALETVFETTARIVSAPTPPPAAPTSLYQIVKSPGRLETRTAWKDTNEPATGTRYIVAADTKHWYRDAGPPTFAVLPFPALVSALEVKNNTELWDLNSAAAAAIATAKSEIQSKMGSAAGGGLFLRDDGNTSDDSLTGDPDSDFLVVPVIYFGDWSGSLTPRGNVAFTPGLANLQPANTAMIVFPKPLMLNASGTDVLEQATAAIVGTGSRFADDWDLYHRLDGEVHCATEVVRTIFGFNWWENQP